MSHEQAANQWTVSTSSTIMRVFNPLLLLLCLVVAICSGLQVAPPSCTNAIRKSASCSSIMTTPIVASLRLSNNPNNDEEQKVRVDLVEDVDSFTLTAIGFSLIAFNFLVLANMGDGGLGGLVARFINFWNS